eukprot:Blabericola_migrator_1__3539@NODE_204_length_11434_cov_295_698249_g175_i0_p1_GENE_NODE_204_length_11434_cov_295_698249_g175_i0NODE_204_length_11434_cov_295_698249_g175_i0_p1_ORF_typecomplete_len764_score198_87Phage_HK97_TLTM/PF06120_11/1_8e04Phage_HK97_TLTM/PF06120_11/1_2Phage_HK97_TLTM/PF06120_11/4_7FAM153/PF15722_5/0_17FAM153/PF15722_5/3_9e03Rab5bind/PF09311_11/0_55Rab5bind/PF09311_11/3_5e02_NODE_204_length_11434_cov_295_698249_g175_i031985489
MYGGLDIQEEDLTLRKPLKRLASSGSRSGSKATAQTPSEGVADHDSPGQVSAEEATGTHEAETSFVVTQGVSMSDELVQEMTVAEESRVASQQEIPSVRVEGVEAVTAETVTQETTGCVVVSTEAVPHPTVSQETVSHPTATHLTASQETLTQPPATHPAASQETVTHPTSSRETVAHPTASQEFRRSNQESPREEESGRGGLGLGGFRFGMLRKAQGVLSTATSTTLKNLATLSEIVNSSLEDIDSAEPVSEGSLPQQPPTQQQATQQPPMQQPPTQQLPITPDLSETESQHLAVINRLSLQMSQLEDSLEAGHQRELTLQSEVTGLRAALEAERRRVSDVEISQERAIREACSAYQASLQQELEQSMVDSTKRITDLKVLLKQREIQLLEFETERERRAHALEETTEAQTQLEVEIQAQKRLEHTLRQELESARQQLVSEAEAWRQKVALAAEAQKIAESRLEEVEERRRRSEQAGRAAEAETRQLQAQVTALKNKLNVLSVLERAVTETVDGLLSEEERQVLTKCASPDDVLGLFKRSHTLITQLERKLVLAEQGTAAATAQAIGLQKSLEAAEHEISSLKARLVSDVSKPGVDLPVRTEIVEADTSVLAMMEARLAAKNERVESLVCEVAQLRSQLAAPSNSTTPTHDNLFLDDGRESLLWLLVLTPIAQLIAKVRGPNAANKFENQCRKYQNRISRSSYVIYTDHKLRLLMSKISSNRTSRLMSMLYVVTLHIILFSLLLTPTPTTLEGPPLPPSDNI